MREVCCHSELHLAGGCNCQSFHFKSWEQPLGEEGRGCTSCQSSLWCENSVQGLLFWDWQNAVGQIKNRQQGWCCCHTALSVEECDRPHTKLMNHYMPFAETQMEYERAWGLQTLLPQHMQALLASTCMSMPTFSATP